MMSQRPFPVPIFLALLAVSCRDRGPASIGDAYPRDAGTAPFLTAIRPAIEASDIRIEGWTVGGDREATIELNSEQATVFANHPSVVGVVGHAGSRDALLGAAVYNARGLPHVVPNATSRMLAKAGSWTFPLAPDDSVEGEFIANFALDSLHAERVAIFYIGDEYGLGLRDGVRSALKKRGPTAPEATMVPAHECLSPMNADVYGAIAGASLLRSAPDVVVLATSTVQGWCLADFIHAQNPEVWILAADGIEVSRTPPATLKHIVRERLRGVEFWSPGTDSLNRAFISLVRSALGRVPTAAEALQYDAFVIMTTAVREAGPNRRAIRDWLESLGRTRPPVTGVTGPIAFNRPRSEILRMVHPHAVTR